MVMSVVTIVIANTTSPNCDGLSRKYLAADVDSIQSRVVDVDRLDVRENVTMKEDKSLRY